MVRFTRKPGLTYNSGSHQPGEVNLRIAERLIITLTLSLFFFSVSCSGISTPGMETSPTPTAPQPTLTQTAPIIEDPALFISEGVPEDWLSKISDFSDITVTENKEQANLILTTQIGKTEESPAFVSTRVYAVVVPFFTVRDEISSNDLKALWSGKEVEGQYQSIAVSRETVRVLSAVWGKPGSSVQVLSPEGLLAFCGGNPEVLAILPFEALSPRWKVLRLDGLSPLDKPLAEDQYPLTIHICLQSYLTDQALTSAVVKHFSNALPVTNRDESKMTVLMMTGTTAITRVLAYKISIKGMDYPIAAVEDWFVNADLKHVSNESPLVEGCPVPDEFSSSLVFCTPPEMIEVLELLGINVIELTGNHINDYGAENLEYTLKAYENRGWHVYAAGNTVEEARSPILIESNGNKVAFIGCNAVGPATVFAKEHQAGAAECDFEYLTREIQDLKQKGYVVITTYQHEEEENLMYFEKISQDFQQAAKAGADIVQGSQAHSPMGFEFVGDNLIHYGLGNFLFDQMVEWNRREFIDRHIIYDGEYISTELLTAMLVDWSRPTPMSKDERTELLEEIFTASLKRKNENK